jgi:drug/metabolite transporter (DMT)-like permease
LGIFLIIGGSVLVSLRKKEKFELSKSFFLVIVSTFLYASSNIILKYCLTYMSFWSTFFWQMTGLFIVTLIAVAFSFNTVKQTIKQFPRAGGFAVVSELLSSGAHLIYILALSLGFITLVSGVMASLPAVTLVFAAITSLFLPKVISEDLKKTTLLQKVIAIALVIVGTYLLL